MHKSAYLAAVALLLCVQAPVFGAQAPARAGAAPAAAPAPPQPSPTAPLYQAKGESLMQAVAEYEERDLQAVIDFLKSANASESVAIKRPDPA